MAAKTFQTRNDLPAESRGKLIDLLNQNLADLTDLYAQTKHAHWNVKGPTFYQVHLLLDELAEKVEEFVDEVAERATALGGVAQGGAKHVAAHSRLPEFPRDTFEVQAVLHAMAERYGIVAKNVRAAIDESDTHGDADTADLFTQVSREIDKFLWFLEAHLQK
jgi:starvation-inducible DNA-binding protein